MTERETRRDQKDLVAVSSASSSCSDGECLCDCRWCIRALLLLLLLTAIPCISLWDQIVITLSLQMGDWSWQCSLFLLYRISFSDPNNLLPHVLPARTHITLHVASYLHLFNVFRSYSLVLSSNLHFHMPVCILITPPPRRHKHPYSSHTHTTLAPRYSYSGGAQHTALLGDKGSLSFNLCKMSRMSGWI